MLILILIAYLARPDGLWSWMSHHELLTIILALVLA